MRKPIQICVSTVPDSLDILFVLCDDGAIYETWFSSSEQKRKWEKIEGLPQEEK